MSKIRPASKSSRVRSPGLPGANGNDSRLGGPGASVVNQDIQHRRLLVGTAYHSGIGDPDSCLTALAILSASRALRGALGRDLGNHESCECRFITLVTLYALEPVACTPDALAHDAEVDLDVMRKVLGFLEERGWVSLEYHRTQGVAPRVHLTESGMEITVLAVHRFLEISATLSGDLEIDERSAAIKACARIVRAAAGAEVGRAKSDLRS